MLLLWAIACRPPAASPGHDDPPVDTDASDSVPADSDSADSDSANSDSADSADPPFEGEAGTVLYVTQVPIAGFASGTGAFGNHLPRIDKLPRGGDLMVRYPDGTERNLTAEAGLGARDTFQGADAIAVREPCVHWSGNKALFAMVIGAPDAQYAWNTEDLWQIYEVTGLARGQTVHIRRVEHQPEDYNNVSPFYGTDDRVFFTSDRPRGGEAWLYPQLDEYESAATVVGLYALDEASASLTLVEHAPSGVFGPGIDSAGRIVYTKWDHLQRDQQGDNPTAAGTYGPLTWASEADGAPSAAWQGTEVFPEPRTTADPAYDPALSTHGFNQFMPWEINEDGTSEETLNHVGRHELGGSYSAGSFVADPNLKDSVPEADHANRTRLTANAGLFDLHEDPLRPGTFYAIYAPEFYTAGGGALYRFDAPDHGNADGLVLDALTTGGHWRDPAPMPDGTLVASYTAVADNAANLGTTEAPAWNYDYRLYAIDPAAPVAAAPLTAGTVRTLEWWSPDVRVRWSGTLWELDAVAVAPRARPARRETPLPAPEAAVFAEAGVDPDAFRAWMRDRGLALIVSRDVTQRDRADLYQPYNLRVPGGVESRGAAGTMYDAAFLQVFQADQVRGYGAAGAPAAGRRALARPMHDGGPSAAGGPEGSVAVGLDGSVAALVPAGRALTWQLTDAAGAAVVRERNWISFAPGEVRVCPACHGVNTASQTGAASPENAPEALGRLLSGWTP